MYSTTDNIRQSLKLAWKYKILWVLALMVGASGLGGGGGGGGGDRLNREEDDKDKNTPQERLFNQNTLNNTTSRKEAFLLERNGDLTSEDLASRDSSLQDSIVEARADSGSPFYQMLDASVKGITTTRNTILDSPSDPTGDTASIVMEMLIAKLKEVNVIPNIIILVVALLVAILYSIVFGLIIKGWAKSALIGNTFKGINSEELKLSTFGQDGLKHMKKMIYLDLWGMLCIFGLILGGGIIIIVASLISPIVSIFATVISGIFVFVFAIKIFYGMLFASRFIITETGISAREAFGSGIKLFSKNFWKAVKLTIGDAMVGCILFLGLALVLGVLAVTVFGLMFAEKTPLGLKVILGSLSVPLVVAAMIGIQMGSGFISTFTEFTWTRLYMFLADLAKAAPVAQPVSPILPPLPVTVDPQLPTPDFVLSTNTDNQIKLNQEGDLNGK